MHARRSRKIAFVAGLGLALSAPPAAATSITFGPRDSVSDEFLLTVADADGINDAVMITRATAFFRVEAVGSPPSAVVPAAGCQTAPDGRGWACGNGRTESELQRTEVRAFLGGGHDYFLLDATVRTQLNGGPGNDTLIGSVNGGTLNGDDGDDRLNLATAFGTGAQGGTVTLNGGLGNDTLDMRRRPEYPDTANGGAGMDTATYLGRGEPVQVNQTVTRGDGSKTEDDTISPDVEQIVGTDFADILVGGPANNVLIGGLGADSLSGGEGIDRLVAGGDGVPDTRIDCGEPTFVKFGADVAVLDLVDPAPVGCEATETAPKDEHPTVAISSLGEVKVTAAGRARVRLSCPKAAPRDCRGTLILNAARRRQAVQRYTLARGRSRTFALPLSRSVAARARKGVEAIVQATEVAGDGRPKTTIAWVRLRR